MLPEETRIGGKGMEKKSAQPTKRMKYGDYIIAVKTPKQTNGMTAAWVTQVSSNPLLVLVAIGKTHYTSEMIREAGCFSINMLRPDQVELAKKCGFGSGKGKDRLAGQTLLHKKTGAPVIADCAAYLDCRLFETLDVGDHVLFIGEVVDMGDTEAELMVHDEEVFSGK